MVPLQYFSVEYLKFNDIINHIALVQLVDTSGHFNHAVSIIRSWIYDSNYKITLALMI